MIERTSFRRLISVDAAREFPEDSWEEHEALTVANEIMDCFLAGKGTDECIKECRQIASKYLGNKVDSAAVYDGDDGNLVYGIGQCHIDTCWYSRTLYTKSH
jgi:alpha-mannosidase